MANTIAYGFLNLKDLFGQRVTQVGFDVVSDAIAQSLEEHDRQMAALTALFADTIDNTKPQIRYVNPTVARLQPMDENGKARPIKPAGFYDVAFPLQMGATAWGNNFVTGVKLTVEEANRFTVTLMEADIRWLRDHILAALYDNAGWTFADDQFGDLDIFGLANGDSVKYLIAAGADTQATDTHYLAQAAAIDDSNNPFPAMYTELMEHPENSGEVVALVPSNLLDSVRGLSDYRPVPDQNVQPASSQEVLTGRLGAVVPGQVWGYVDKVWISEWRALPNDYIIGVASDGDRALAKREDPEAELQGFKQATSGTETDNYPWFERQYFRRCGFGARNRVNALVQRIGNGSYAVPTGYATPMA